MAGINKRITLHGLEATLLSLAFIVAIGGCWRTSSSNHTASEGEIRSFVDQLRQLGIEAKLRVGYERSCEITISNREKFKLLPSSGAVPLRYRIRSMSLDKNDIELLFVNRNVLLFDLTKCSLTPDAFERLCDVGSFGEFRAEKVSFTNHKGGPSQELSLDVQFVEIKDCSSDFAKASLPLIGSTRNFRLDAEEILHVDLDRLQVTETLSLDECQVSLANPGRFQESPMIQTLVLEDSHVDSSVIATALRIPSLRTVALTRCHIPDLQFIDFPYEVHVRDFIVDDADIAEFFRENVSSETSVNGKPGLKKRS